MAPSILIIDSRKDGYGPSNNLHWRNAKILSDYLGAQLIWSNSGVNDNIKGNFDIIIFNHASHYSYVDDQWLMANRAAKLFYIKNEYNIGEPRILWRYCRETGATYDVIANHTRETSRKLNKKFVANWHVTNLNSLIYDHKEYNIVRKNNLIYYGAYRNNRSDLFKKYLNNLVISTTNPKKFINLLGPRSITYVPKLDWFNNGLSGYSHSLYLEDTFTHTHYNFLANRFYESISYHTIPVFIEECQNTIDGSNYNINVWDFEGKLLEWQEKAEVERIEVLKNIYNIVMGAI